MIVLAIPHATLWCQTITASGGGYSNNVITQTLQGAPKISVEDFGNPAVAISAYSLMGIGIDTPNFSTYQTADLMPVLPFSALLTNHSAKQVIACTVRWSTVDTDSSPYDNYQTVCDCINLQGLVNSGASALAIPISGNLDHNAMTKAGEELRSKQEVTISLDAIMFSDGSVAGKDRGHTLAEIKARLKAEYDLCSLVAGDSSNDLSLLSKLQEMRDRVKPGSTIKIGSDRYHDWYQVHQARQASLLIRVATEHGVGYTKESVKNILRGKKYPELMATW